MTITERSRSRVQAAIERLEARFGAFPVREEAWSVTPDEYAFTRERFRAGTLGGAGVWVRNRAGEVLLVRDAERTGWGDPGGKHEPGESLAETARRELREETGIEADLDGVLEAREIEMRPTESAAPPIVRLIVLFVGTYRRGEPRPEPGEIDAVAWWDRHPEELMYDAVARYPIPADDWVPGQ